MSLRGFLGNIDRGYDDGVATSNMVMGLAVVILGLVALNVEAEWLQTLCAVAAAFVFVIFAWRMILSFRRQAESADRRRSRNG